MGISTDPVLLDSSQNKFSVYWLFLERAIEAIPVKYIFNSLIDLVK